jgi:two-component system C4-dicarboxylate transport response regulator DctD
VHFPLQGSAEELVLLGHSQQIEDLRKTIGLLADAPVPVIVRGETGTGKELVARCLHHRSRSRNLEFVVLNCRALCEKSGEHECLDGSVNSRRMRGKPQGHIAWRRGATVLLEDVDALCLSAQAKLVRILQENGHRPGHSNNSVRVIASTRSNLRSLCERNAFLCDLYYTLCGAQIVTAPLREMREDILTLFRNFLSQAAARYNKEVPDQSVTLKLVPRLLAHSWPGNVRELRNVADRLLLGLLADPLDSEGNETIHTQSLSEQTEHFERQIILHHLRLQRGNVAATSELLAIPKTTLYDKLHKYRISVDGFKTDALCLPETQNG